MIRIAISLIYVFVLLNFILLQGSFYWFIKWKRTMINKTVLPKLSVLQQTGEHFFNKEFFYPLKRKLMLK